MAFLVHAERSSSYPANQKPPPIGEPTPAKRTKKQRAGTNAFLKKVWRNSILLLATPHYGPYPPRQKGNDKARKTESPLVVSSSISDVKDVEPINEKEGDDTAAYGLEIPVIAEVDMEIPLVEGRKEEEEAAHIVSPNDSTEDPPLREPSIQSTSASEQDGHETITNLDADEVTVFPEEDSKSDDAYVDYLEDPEETFLERALRRRSWQSIYTDTGSLSSATWISPGADDDIDQNGTLSSRRRSMRAARRSTFRSPERAYSIVAKTLNKRKSARIPSRVDGMDNDADTLRRHSKRMSRASLENLMHQRSMNRAQNRKRRTKVLSTAVPDADHAAQRSSSRLSVASRRSRSSVVSRYSFVEITAAGRSRTKRRTSSVHGSFHGRRNTMRTSAMVLATTKSSLLQLYDQVLADHAAAPEGEASDGGTEAQESLTDKFSTLQTTNMSMMKLDELLGDLSKWCIEGKEELDSLAGTRRDNVWVDEGPGGYEPQTPLRSSDGSFPWPIPMSQEPSTVTPPDIEHVPGERSLSPAPALPRTSHRRPPSTISARRASNATYSDTVPDPSIPTIRIVNLQYPNGTNTQSPFGDGYDLRLHYGAASSTVYLATLRNGARHPLPFTWEMADVSGDASQPAKSATGFEIYPTHGWIPANGDMIFEIVLWAREEPAFDVLAIMNLGSTNDLRSEWPSGAGLTERRVGGEFLIECVREGPPIAEPLRRRGTGTVGRRRTILLDKKKGGLRRFFRIVKKAF